MSFDPHEFNDRLEFLKTKVLDLYEVRLDVTHIEWSGHGLTAGWALPKGLFTGVWRDRLGISREIAETNHDYTLAEVLPHEVAHLTMGHLNENYRIHNRAWREIVINLGGKGDIKHPFKLSRQRRSRQFEYKTSHGAIAWLGNKVHNKLLKQHRTRLIGDERISIANFTGNTRALV